tara:strand:+ start:61100 stop:61837 length:738 start_codon:yes stop_codon:yes gene_type:complete
MRVNLTFCLILAFCAISSAQNLLVYTHNGEGYVHDNIEASVKALEKLASQNNFTIQTTDDPEFFTTKNLKNIDCIIFSNTNNEAFYTQSQRDAFKNYINDGGGFAGIHVASGSERNWDWFAAMLGGRFVRHPKLQEFDIAVIDSTHMSTNFLPKIWHWEDECYYLDNLNPDIYVLLAADLTTVTDDKKDEYPDKVFGDYAPLAWYHNYDGGRQFYTALGHKKEYYSNPQFLNHILGGIKWVLNEN